MFEDGRGVSKDFIQAAFWYKKSAEQENSIAQYNLAKLYINGYGVQKDFNIAEILLKRSINNGCTEAKKLLDNLNKNEDCSDFLFISITIILFIIILFTILNH